MAATPKTYQRLTDKELAFYENNIARTLDIISAIALLGLWTQDEEVMDVLDQIQTSAINIKTDLIAQMRQRKQQTKKIRASLRKASP